jgi:hypothetical protein
VSAGLRAWLQRRRAARSYLFEPPSDLADAPTVSLPAREYFLYRGPIDVVPRFEHLPGHLQTPNMWWPEDLAWFVAEDRTLILQDFYEWKNQTVMAEDAIDNLALHLSHAFLASYWFVRKERIGFISAPAARAGR